MYAAQSEGPTTIFLPVSFNIWFVCSKEPSFGDFEYPLWLRNKKNNLSGWIGISRCVEKSEHFFWSSRSMYRSCDGKYTCTCILTHWLFDLSRKLLARYALCNKLEVGAR